MAKTKIEWCDFTINPVKGLCPVACSYCYARRMYKRFHWDESIRFDHRSLSYEKLSKIPDDSKVFIGSTMELFGSWINDDWLADIFDTAICYPTLTFIFLTKKPENLIKWSPFPENCWVGTTITNNGTYIRDMEKVSATVKFLSIEPLLRWDTDLIRQREEFPHILNKLGINWLIIGQQTPTSAKTMPTVKSITEIMTAADRVNIPIFLKNNLSGFLPFRQHYNKDYHDKCYKLRQEFPTIQNTSEPLGLKSGGKNSD